MLKYIILILFLYVFPSSLKAQHPPVFEGMVMDTAFLTLSDLNINLVKYSYGKPKISFLVIHDDEDTGVKAAFEYIMFSGGSLVDCQYGGTRNFRFSYAGTNFQTDPNSIYSYEGVVMGLEKYDNIDSDEMIRRLQETSKSILNYYNAKQLGYMFTLHNNADGGFGILSYLQGAELEDVADSVHVNADMDPDDLILVTETALFNHFKKQNVNVILQSDRGPEDGSLSVYAMYNKIPYLNVEVQHGHQYEHLRLIEIAIKGLYETYPHLIKKATD
jgi:hypothetical protein